MPISAVGTKSRAGTPPDLRPDEFPDAIVRYQQAPDSPDPTGLAAAFKLIGTPNVFRDLTALDLNQQVIGIKWTPIGSAENEMLFTSPPRLLPVHCEQFS